MVKNKIKINPKIQNSTKDMSRCWFVLNQLLFEDNCKLLSSNFLNFSGAQLMSDLTVETVESRVEYVGEREREERERWERERERGEISLSISLPRSLYIYILSLLSLSLSLSLCLYLSLSLLSLSLSLSLSPLALSLSPLLSLSLSYIYIYSLLKMSSPQELVEQF